MCDLGAIRLGPEANLVEKTVRELPTCTVILHSDVYCAVHAIHAPHLPVAYSMPVNQCMELFIFI